MLNYEEELKKFKPSLDIEDVEDAVYREGMTDVIDLFKDIERGKRGSSRERSEQNSNRTKE